MSLGLISIGGDVKCLSVNYESLSDASCGFYINPPAGLIHCNSRFSWRLTGSDGAELLSLDIVGGVITAIELILYKNIEHMELDYFVGVDAIAGLPLLGFFPTVSPRGVMGEVAVDIERDFYVEKYNNCIRVFWGDASWRVFAAKKICFEFSEDFILVGLAVFDDGLKSFD